MRTRRARPVLDALAAPCSPDADRARRCRDPADRSAADPRAPGRTRRCRRGGASGSRPRSPQADDRVVDGGQRLVEPRLVRGDLGGRRRSASGFRTCRRDGCRSRSLVQQLLEFGEVAFGRRPAARPLRSPAPVRAWSRRRSRSRRPAWPGARRSPRRSSTRRARRRTAPPPRRVSNCASLATWSRAASRVPAGAGSPRRYLPVSSPEASGKNGTKPSPSRSHVGSTSRSASRCEQAVVVLDRREPGRSPVARDRVGLLDLLGAEVRGADVADDAGADELVERLERLGDRRHAVGLVVPVVVDHVGAKPPQRRLDAPGGCSRATRAGPAVAHVHPELGREHDLVAPALEHLAEELLAPPVGVSVGVRGVEERDPLLERGVHDRARAFEVDPPAEVVAAEADRSETSGPSTPSERLGRSAIEDGL